MPSPISVAKSSQNLRFAFVQLFIYIGINTLIEPNNFFQHIHLLALLSVDYFNNDLLKYFNLEMRPSNSPH